MEKKCFFRAKFSVRLLSVPVSGREKFHTHVQEGVPGSIRTGRLKN
jgi:hypothetical protein